MRYPTGNSGALFLPGHERVWLVRQEKELSKYWPGTPGSTYAPETRRRIPELPAAGLAYPESGEGIRPAIESGLLAAKAILAARGSPGPELAELYCGFLAGRFGSARKEWFFNLGRHAPTWLISSLARFLLSRGWFSRHIVLERWFLHRGEPALGS